MKIAVFTLDSGLICPFFEANGFLIFEKDESGWRVGRKESFAPFLPASPAVLRAAATELLPVISDCDILAGGELSGIVFSVFDRAGLHIFEIGAINDVILDSMTADVADANAQQNIKEKIVNDVRPVPAGTDGIYFLDLVLLQTECPEVSSKKAMKDFFANTPFLELHLICRHIPPWIENEGNLQIKAQQKDGGVYAVIRRKC